MLLPMRGSLEVVIGGAVITTMGVVFVIGSFAPPHPLGLT